VVRLPARAPRSPVHVPLMSSGSSGAPGRR
jgi:hypothetical protein